jgi:signal transduction histidine kinase
LGAFIRGGITRRIPSPRNELWIEIYDTGIGVPVYRIDTIFGEPHQLDPRREGLGLGLWIARSTTEVLGHEPSVRSAVGRGSRFRLVVSLGTARKPQNQPVHVSADQVNTCCKRRVMRPERRKRRRRPSG